MKPLTDRQRKILAMDRAEWWKLTLNRRAAALFQDGEYAKAGRVWKMASRATMRYYDLATDLMRSRSVEFGLTWEEGGI